MEFYAFFSYSTDEDARQAMMHDREAINGVQIRLLLSSRAEMQKVIETARQQSLLVLKKTSGVALAQPKASPPAVIATNIQKAAIAPQPPIITASSFQNILSSSAAAITPSFLTYQKQAGFNLMTESNTTSSTKNNNDSDDSSSRYSRDRHRSISRECRRSRSRSKDRGIFRRRRERSRDRSRERDWTNGRRSSRHRSRSREKNRTRSRDRSHDRERSRANNRDSDRRNSYEGSSSRRSRGSDSDMKAKANTSSWSLTNSYQASYNTSETSQISVGKLPSSSTNINKSIGLTSPAVAVTAVSTTFQNYNIANQSLTAFNNYSLSGIIGTNSSDSFKGFALQNPYTTAQNDSAIGQENDSKTTSSSAIPGIFVEKKAEENDSNEVTIEGVTSLPQEPIAFANVNPYEQMYPTLFAQAAALNSGQKSGISKQASVSMPTNSPKSDENGSKEVDPNETNCVKLCNMCPRTTYSDLRKFFIGLFIPHNGIKLLNDKHGLRIGIAYVQFSRQSSVSKALCRSNNLLRGRSVIIEAVSEQEFLEAEDSFRPPNQDRGNDSDNENGEHSSQNNNSSGFSSLNPYKKSMQSDKFCVLYIEDIPSLATEQDIMKMFSSYSLYDILLIASPENRREFVAYVRFSREEDAKSAYEDRAHHQIGYRRVRVRSGSLEDMENAKERIRLANEQLLKEEQAAEEEEAKRKEETKRKLEKLITDHITQEELKQQNIISMDLTNDDGDGDGDVEIIKSDIIEITKDVQGDENNDDDVKDISDEGDRQENLDNIDMQQMSLISGQTQLNKFNANLDPRRPQTPGIPSLFDLDPMNNIRTQNRPNLFNDPRLRNMSDRTAVSAANAIEGKTNNATMMGSNNYNSNLNSSLNSVKDMNPPAIINNTEKNFVILKNCDYNTRINDVAQLLLTANLALKHIEPLRNERLLPTGEFIVEFRRSSDAEISVKRFHNIQFRNRSLRVFPISPQEIADRLGKPFLSYIPGGNGVRMTKSMAIDRLARNDLNLSNSPMSNNNSMRYGKNSQQSVNIDSMPRSNPFSDNGKNGKLNMNSSNSSGGNSIPDKFNNPGCVLSMENVPYKAQISDILRFFQGFDLMPDDIIRRFNDDGSPTGDARVAFNSPEEARDAFDARKRKQIYGRNIFIRIL